MSAETKPLNILHTEASLGWGGQEIRVLTEAAGMQQRGHRVWVAAPPEAKITERAAQFGVQSVALPIGRKRLPGLFALRGWLKTQAIDIINTHSSTDTWLAALACIGLRNTHGQQPKIVRTRHISAPVKNDWANRWLYGKAVKRVVTTGEAISQLLVNTLGLRQEQVLSIPTGIDLQRYQPRLPEAQPPHTPESFGFPSGAKMVGIVATLRSWKGHRYLVEALQQVPDLCLVIVGDGPGWEPLHQQVAQLGLQQRVKLVGNQADVVPYLQSMDLFCLPSYANEGVPQALLQAMACGLPIVTTPVGAIPEIIRHEDNGLIVPPQSVPPLAEALQRLVNDPALQAKLSEGALRYARAHADIALMLNRMEAVFTQALASD
jgi:glycosyltransferase involved in cell wall biosynthesis